MATLTLRIPDELESELALESKERGISKSDVARDALQRHLSILKLNRLRQDLAPFVEAQGIFTEEDVIKRLEEP
jgi:hypothetical protein